MNVSVIIPARNAADTLGDTLESLIAQTYPSWEAIVVDDGSTDRTPGIAAEFAARDRRILTSTEPHAGEVAARNAGIGHARFDWLLFLDSDDWLLPTALERLAAAIGAAPGLDAVYGRWARVAPDGTRVEESYWPEAGDLFPVAARFCPFAIHACLVRRALVEEVGAFRPGLRPCEDWDLWQRLGRAGARFGRVDEVLALYRMRPGSAVSDARALLEHGLEIIARGHSADPRVPRPVPAYANGMPRAGLDKARLSFVCWPAGMLLGAGDDARPLLDAVATDRDPELEPAGVAHSIFRAALLPGCHAPNAWAVLWPRVEDRIGEFLDALEGRAGARGLARRARRTLERLIGESVRPRWPCTIGSWRFTNLEVTRPLEDVATETDWLQCAVEAEGESLGMLELPVCDGLVTSDLLADAAVADLAWLLLGRFFARSLYPLLEIRREGAFASVWRGDVCLADRLPAEEAVLHARLHEAVGWTVFLQELWGRPAWRRDEFYDPTREGEPGAVCSGGGEVRAVEASHELPDLETGGRSMEVELRVGGVPVALVAVPSQGGRIPAQGLRAALTAATGYELCRAAVREGLISLPLSGGGTLRERLGAAASRTRDRESPARPLAGVVSAPGWERALRRAVGDGRKGLVLARHALGHPSMSVSRRAAFPVAAAPDLVDAAAASGEPVLRVEGAGRELVVYAPDLLWRREARSGLPESRAPLPGGTEEPSRFDQHHFETVFHATRDPWRYATPFEQLKYEQTLALLPAGPIERALELACAEGVFTAQLAPRVGSLLASDISRIALDRAAERCRAMANVAFARLDFIRDPLPAPFDVIVCSEVLYYVSDQGALEAVARKVAGALRPGGHLLTTHCSVVGDDPASPGLDWDVPFGARRIGEILASTRVLRLVKELRTPLYRVQLFRRAAGLGALLPRRFRRPPEVIEAQCLPPEPPLAARVLLGGGQPRKGGLPRAVTWRLPILMYHQVSPSGPGAFARYRVTPGAFEEQLRYLREAGFRGIGLEEWRRALERWEPVSGRAVLLTFDDGYRDFAQEAWPLLERYGFSALVFLVADRVGGTNAWDEAYGEPAPLMGWDEIRRLRDSGVEFGSHSASHPFLTSLSPVEVVREAARSRGELTRGLGGPVTAFAYPHGAEDPAIHHLVGACGYLYGLSCRPGPASFRDPLLALPRIEVTGSDTLADFIGKLGS